MANEIKLDVSIKNTIASDLKRIQRQLDKLPEEAYKFFKAQTPIRSGNARRKTRLDKGKEEIVADYPYAERLDTGYSKQAPKGMTKPTEQYIKKRLKQIMRKK